MKTTKNVLKLCLIALVMLSFGSCEWDGSNDMNYVEVSKPEVEVPDPSIELGYGGGVINPEEVIQMVNGTDFTFNILPKSAASYSAIEYNVAKIKTSWGNYSASSGEWGWSSTGPFHYSFNFTIPESAVDGETKEMKIEFDISRVLKRQDASLSEKLPRLYQMTYTSNVRLINESDVTLKNITFAADDEGFLKLLWDKLDVNIEKIEVYNNYSQLLGTVQDPNNSSFFVDRTYIGGYQYYDIHVYLKNTIGLRKFTFNTTIDEPRLTYEHASATKEGGKVKFEWHSPNTYPTKYVLSINDKLYNIANGVNSLEIDESEIGWDSYAYLYCLPLDTDYKDYQSCHNTHIYIN